MAANGLDLQRGSRVSSVSMDRRTFMQGAAAGAAAATATGGTITSALARTESVIDQGSRMPARVSSMHELPSAFWDALNFTPDRNGTDKTEFPLCWHTLTVIGPLTDQPLRKLADQINQLAQNGDIDKRWMIGTSIPLAKLPLVPHPLMPSVAVGSPDGTPRYSLMVFVYPTSAAAYDRLHSRQTAEGRVDRHNIVYTTAKRFDDPVPGTPEDRHHVGSDVADATNLV